MEWGPCVAAWFLCWLAIVSESLPGEAKVLEWFAQMVLAIHALHVRIVPFMACVTPAPTYYENA